MLPYPLQMSPGCSLDDPQSARVAGVVHEAVVHGRYEEGSPHAAADGIGFCSRPITDLAQEDRREVVLPGPLSLKERTGRPLQHVEPASSEMERADRYD